MIWDATKTGTELLCIKAADDPETARLNPSIVGLAFFPDGRSLVGFTSDGFLKRWDVTNGKLLSTLSLGDCRWLYAVALSQNGKLAVSAHENGKIHVWQVETGACLKSIQLPAGSRAKSLALSADTKKVLAGLNCEQLAVRRGTVRWESNTVRKTVVLDVPTGQRDCELPTTFTDAQFSPSGKLLVTCDSAGIRVWIGATGRNVHTLAKEPDCQQVIPSPDGNLLIGRTAYGVWGLNIQTGECVLGRANLSGLPGDREAPR